MNRVTKSILFGLMSSVVLVSCDDDDDDNNMTSSNQGNLTVNTVGLESLGDDYEYEGWLIVNGQPVSAGLFDIDANGNPTATNFTVSQSDLSNASAYVLTIEPSPDNDPAPSAVHILAGDFSSNTAPLTVNHSSAIGTDFTSATGKYILATPTDGGDMTDELSGVWWLDPMAGPGPGLDLPTLPAGWVYEGWAVIGGTPISTGTFTSASGADNAAPYSGSVAGPPFPGEDFLMNAPSGVTFPTDLSGQTVVISVEPSPDNSAAPFLLKPLVGMVPSGASDRTPYDMGNNATATNPTGTVMR